LLTVDLKIMGPHQDGTMRTGGREMLRITVVLVVLVLTLACRGGGEWEMEEVTVDECTEACAAGLGHLEVCAGRDGTAMRDACVSALEIDGELADPACRASSLDVYVCLLAAPCEDICPGGACSSEQVCQTERAAACL